ncbi:MAG: sugar transferase [Selenomonadaceae bacterium]
MRSWDELPEDMKNDAVRFYYDILAQRQSSIVLKRCLDCILAIVVFAVVAIPMLLIAIMIKLDSPGAVFYRQERVTIYGKRFRIHKFRTMVSNADRLGALVTVSGDARVTRVGKLIRDCRLDELPQVIDVLQGNMSFVGTRPEVVKYVEKYTDEMKATLLLPAGITSEASIRYKDEARLLDAADDVDMIYVQDVLPSKMCYNLRSIKYFSVSNDLKTMLRTVMAVTGKEYS